MIPVECKRLAEVDFPIAVVSKYSAAEKRVRHGHPSTLHLWWARRPLAACRSILLGLLLPDPCDPQCPSEFKTDARRLLAGSSFIGIKPGSSDLDLRRALLRFIGSFANWECSSQPDYLAVGQGLVKAAYPEDTPLVADPFAGGGAIPLEAVRVGCDTFATDLNPVACLILRVMLEDVPKYGRDLADILRTVGGRVDVAATTELAELYPSEEDGFQPIAYLWARTVRCEAPNCGAEMPLMSSFWLCKKSSRRKALLPQVVRSESTVPEVCFEIFEPSSDGQVHGPTVNGARATCLCCNYVMPPERVRAQLRQQHGGADVVFDADGGRVGGARLLAVVGTHPSERGRCYRLPNKRDYKAVWRASQRLADLVAGTAPSELSPVPDEPTPVGGGKGAGRAFSLRKYGMADWGDMFTARQKLALHTIAREIRDVEKWRRPISLALGKLIDLSNAVCPWEPIAECPRNVLSNGRIRTSWSFAEAVPISDSSGSLTVCVDNLASGIASVGPLARTGYVELAAAQKSPLPDASVQIWFTDPPYYDAIPYADLSDMLFAWYRRTLTGETAMGDPFDATNVLTPKDLEIVQDESRSVEGRPKDKAFFEEEMHRAFQEGRRVLQESGIGCVVFAHKTTEGWEALLSGLLAGRWTITGSWPIATEMASRLRARDSAALETSVHLICRPRPENAPVGDWADVLRELPQRVGDWMERLQQEGVRGADLVFACIGPALEVYSRYSQVETAEGHVVPLGGDPEAFEPQKRGFLAYVWEVIGRTALGQVLGTAEAKARNGAVGALEEDARLTALFLWTLQATANGNRDEDEDEAPARGRSKGFSLAYDVARRFAQPLGIHLDQWEDRIIEMKGGTVRLLPISERATQLFGKGGAQAVADRIETDASAQSNPQMTLFPDEAPTVRGRRHSRSGADVSDGDLETTSGATTLDRIHAAMLLQAGGRTNALRALLRAEVDRGPDFVRLANALSALYPGGSEEKRLVDAMLLAVPR